MHVPSALKLQCKIPTVAHCLTQTPIIGLAVPLLIFPPSDRKEFLADLRLHGCSGSDWMFWLFIPLPEWAVKGGRSPSLLDSPPAQSIDIDWTGMHIWLYGRSVARLILSVVCCVSCTVWRRRGAVILLQLCEELAPGIWVLEDKLLFENEGSVGSILEVTAVEDSSATDLKKRCSRARSGVMRLSASYSSMARSRSLNLR